MNDRPDLDEAFGITPAATIERPDLDEAFGITPAVAERPDLDEAFGVASEAPAPRASEVSRATLPESDEAPILRKLRLNPERAQKTISLFTPEVDEQMRPAWKALTDSARNAGYFGDKALGSDAASSRKNYEGYRNQLAADFNLDPEDVDDLVKHRMGVQKEEVSRDAIGVVHIKDDILARGTKDIASAIWGSNLPESVKEQTSKELPQRVTAFKEGVLANVRQNHPELADSLDLSGDVEKDYATLNSELNRTKTGQFAGGVAEAVTGRPFAAIGAYAPQPGVIPSAADIQSIRGTQDRSQQMSKKQASVNQLSEFINQEKVRIFGTNAATIGQGVSSAVESVAIAAMTGGLGNAVISADRIAKAGKVGAVALKFAQGAINTAPVAGVFGADSTLRTYEQALEAGKPEDEATRLALTSGAIEFGVTAAFGGLPKFGGLEDVGQALRNPAVRQQVGKSVAKAWGELSVDVAKGMVGEITEESIITALDTLAVQAEINPNMTQGDLKKSLYDTVVATVFAAGPMVGGSAIREQGMNLLRDPAEKVARTLAESAAPVAPQSAVAAMEPITNENEPKPEESVPPVEGQIEAQPPAEAGEILADPLATDSENFGETPDPLNETPTLEGGTPEVPETGSGNPEGSIQPDPVGDTTTDEPDNIDIQGETPPAAAPEPVPAEEAIPEGVPPVEVQPTSSGPAVAEPSVLGTPRAGFDNQFVTPEGATIELLPDGKASFIVPPDQRGSGAGNAAVERVKQHADATGTTIKLGIEPLGNEPGMNRAELADWYERRGFTVSPDRLSAEYVPGDAEVGEGKVDLPLGEERTDQASTNPPSSPGGETPADGLSWIEGMYRQGEEEGTKAQEESAAKKSIETAQTKTVVDKLESAAMDFVNQIKDWKSRQYKSNSKRIELIGDGPSRQGDMSITQINESKRRRAIEELQLQVDAATKLSEGIADGSIKISDVFAKVEEAKKNADREMAIQEKSIGPKKNNRTLRQMQEGQVSNLLLGDKNYRSGPTTVASYLLDTVEAMQKSQPTQSPNEPNTQRPESPPAEAAQPTPAETGAPGGAAPGDGGTARGEATAESSVAEDPEFVELEGLMLRRGQAQNKVKGVKFSTKDEARFQELGLKFRDQFIAKVDPETDELLGTNDRGEPIYWSDNARTHYSISEGRVRTAPWIDGLPDSAQDRLEELLTASESSPPPAPEFGNPPVDESQATEPLPLEAPLPELPNFEDALEEDSVTGLYHAQTDADRARLGLPPRFKQPRTTDQEAWDRATAAEDAHRAAGLPGTAGSDLLTNLLSDVPRVIDKNEHALLLHEKLVREQAVEAAMTRLNNLPADTPDGVRKDAQAAVAKAQDAFDQLVTYADAAGSRAGLSLQARKMLIYTDFSLAAVVNRLKAAKNAYSDSPVPWTEKDQAAAIAIANKLQQAQERVDALEADNSEQALLIEQLTKDVERAQTKLENRMRTSRARKLVTDKLDPLVEAAKARMAARNAARRAPSDQQGNMSVFGPTPEQVEDLKDIAIIASGWIANKALSLEEFSRKLTAEFGDWVAEHAQAIFRNSRSLYIETAESVTPGGTAAPTPESVVKDIDATEPLDKADVWKLARAHVVAGKRGRNVLDSVFGDLSAVFPDLTREQVAEAFTGYGTVVYPSDKEVPKELRRIRSLERIGLKLKDVRAGVMPKRTGLQRGEQDAEVRELEKQFREGYRALEEQMRASGIPMEDAENRIKTALGAAKRRMENEIEEMDRAIASGQARAKREGVNFDADPTYVDLKKRLKEKRAEYSEAFKTEPDKLQQAKDATSKSIDRYLRMLVSGNTQTEAKPAGPSDPELVELKSLRDTFAKQVAEARKVRPTADEVAKRERDAALTSAEKTLAELERRITENDLSAKAKGEVRFADDTEIKAVRDQIAAAREVIKEMKKAATPAKDPVQAVLKSLDRQIAEEEQMLRDGILKKAKPATLSTPEIETRRAKLREMRANRRELYSLAFPVDPLVQAKESAAKAGERLQKMILEGDVAVRRKEPVDADAELQALWDANEAMRDQIDEMRKLVPLTDGEIKDAIEKDLQRIEETVTKIQAKLDAGDLSIETKPVSQRAAAVSADPRIQAARERVKSLNKELASRRRAADALTKMSPEEAREKRILGSIKKRREELERRIRESDFTTKEKLPPVNTEATRKANYELDKVRSQFDEMRNKYILANAPFGQKVSHYAISSGNLLKLMVLGMDIGVVMRQLGTSYQALARDLGMLAPTAEGARRRADGSYLKRILGTGLKVIGSREAEHATYERLMAREMAGWDKTAGLVLNAPFDIQRNSKEDIPPANLLDEIPWWIWPTIAAVKVSMLGASFPVSAATLALGVIAKPTLQALDRAQRAMTNESRAMFFDEAMRAIHDGQPTVAEAKALAKAVMVGTGRGTGTQSIESAIPLLNQFILATRYYISIGQAITLYPLWNKDARQSAAARKQIAKMYGRSVAGRATLLTLAAFAFGKSLAGDDDEPEEGLIINPFNLNFLRLRLAEGVAMDFASGRNNFASIIARYTFRQRVDPATGRTMALGGGYSNNVKDEALRFLSSKLNIQFSFLLNTHAGQYFGGKPVTPANALEEITTAIIINDTQNVYRAMMEEYGPVEGAAKATVFLGLMFGGAGTSVQDDEAVKEANRIAKKEAEWERNQRESELNE